MCNDQTKFNEILVKSMVKSIKNQNSKSIHNLFGVVSRATHFFFVWARTGMQKEKMSLVRETMFRVGNPLVTEVLMTFSL